MNLREVQKGTGNLVRIVGKMNVGGYQKNSDGKYAFISSDGSHGMYFDIHTNMIVTLVFHIALGSGLQVNLLGAAGPPHNRYGFPEKSLPGCPPLGFWFWTAGGGVFTPSFSVLFWAFLPRCPPL